MKKAYIVIAFFCIAIAILFSFCTLSEYVVKRTQPQDIDEALPLSAFHGKWEGRIINWDDVVSFNIDAANGTVWLSSPKFNEYADWKVENETLELSMNDGEHRIVITLVISESRNALDGSFSQYDITTDITLELLSDMPEKATAYNFADYTDGVPREDALEDFLQLSRILTTFKYCTKKISV